MTRVLPSRAELVDAGFLVVAGLAVLLGLGSTYTGAGFALVGLLGLVLGVAVAHVARAWRLPFVVPVAAGVLVYFVLGPPLCLRSTGDALPAPGAWGRLADQALFGWKQLLTTLPPVDGDGPLLALPWLLGLVAGIVGTWLAGVRSGPAWLRALLPALAPIVLLAVVILLGLGAPDSLWVQGVMVAALGPGWVVLRWHRAAGPVVSGRARWSRLAVGAGLVGVVAVAAAPVGTWAVGGTEADGQRLILREYVEPPFDIGRYPSPLAAFRKYVEIPDRAPDQRGNLYDTELLTLQGAPAGARVRFATLDSYDGVVWNASDNAISGASDPGSRGSGSRGAGFRGSGYQRVGSVLDNPATGPAVDLSFTVGPGWSGVWLPTVGALQELHFDTRTEELAGSFRYNLDASSGVVPLGVRPGDRYRARAVLADREATPEDRASSGLATLPPATSFLDEKAAVWTEGITDPMQRVFAIAEHLRMEGKYSDGVLPREEIYRPGHFISRLDEGFVNADLIVGNDEQYAAAMALFAVKVGVPARVVLGAVVPAGAADRWSVKGSDVSAWVELQVADGSWRTLSTEAFMSDNKPAEQQTKTRRELSGMVIPPPAQVPPPSTIGEQADSEINARRTKKDQETKKEVTGLPAWVRLVLLYTGGPLLALLLAVVAILLMKGLRRSRRRTRGPVSTRIVGGWRELVDHARDLGQPVPVLGVTRQEQSAFIASAEAARLAKGADVTVFGSSPPPDEAAASYWDSILAQRRELSTAATRRRRLRAALSLRTFWRRSR